MSEQQIKLAKLTLLFNTANAYFEELRSMFLTHFIADDSINDIEEAMDKIRGSLIYLKSDLDESEGHNENPIGFKEQY